jgi:hypothetical protein
MNSPSNETPPPKKKGETIGFPPPGPLWTTNPPGSSLLPLALEAPQKNMGKPTNFEFEKQKEHHVHPFFVAEFICLR